MSKRAANFTQADVHRALKAAQQAGPDWRITIEGSLIHIIRGETTPAVSDKVVEDVHQEDEAPEKIWKM